MRLVHRIILSVLVPMILTLGLWGWLSFRTMERKIHSINVEYPESSIYLHEEILIEHVLLWTILLFAVLLVCVVAVGVIVTDYNLRPLRSLLKWIDEYVPGKPGMSVPADTRIIEFRRLADATQQAVNRFEYQFEERRVFIGNVSHELQTPLAVCSNHIELLLDRNDLNEEIAGELVKIHRNLQNLIRMNKSLLLLTKIENDQFAPDSSVSFNRLLKDSLSLYTDIYEHKSHSVSFKEEGEFSMEMNEQLSSVLVNNLIKNAFVHSAAGSSIAVEVGTEGFSVSNTGDSPLDSDKLFRRFYQPSGRREGSTGLGLALVWGVCVHSGLDVTYRFTDGLHVFVINLKKSK